MKGSGYHKVSFDNLHWQLPLPWNDAGLESIKEIQTMTKEISKW